MSATTSRLSGRPVLMCNNGRSGVGFTEKLTEADLPAAYQGRFEEIRSFYAGWRVILLG